MATHKKKVLIVGAGVSGLAVGAFLARRGLSVTVLEKNDTHGGRCSTMTKGGYRFDVGASLFLMPEIFEETFAALGEKMSDHLDLHRIDPTSQLHFDDGISLELSPDTYTVMRQFEKLEPGSTSRYLAFMAEGAYNYQNSIPQFITRDYHHLFDYINIPNFFRVRRLGVFKKHFKHMGRFFRDIHLKAAMTYQNIYIGMSPHDAPAMNSMFPYMEIVQGLHYPRGGMGKISDAFLTILKNAGGSLETGRAVRRILLDGNTATGVQLKNGETLSADFVVANADAPYVYRQLLPPSRYAKKLNRMDYAASAFCFYWGVRGRVTEIDKQHTIFLTTDYTRTFTEMFKQHTLPTNAQFYLHAPVRHDPAAAPEGDDAFTVIVPTGHVFPGQKQDWDALKARARKTVLDRFARIGVTDLEKRIVFEEVLTPPDWETHLNLSRGAVFGSLSHTIWQSGYFRPANQHHSYKNVFLTGGSARPGNGVPMVLVSARLTAARVLDTAGLTHDLHYR